MKNKIASIILSFSVFFLIVTFSIGLPIYFRPFFYAHIEPLDLVAESGFSRSEIIEAYNEVLDYLTIPGKPFGTGAMCYSEEGASHFADCKILFNLNAIILLLSVTVTAVISILYRKSKITDLRIGPFFAGFYGAVAAIVIPLVIGYWAFQNFSKVFTVFHKILFRGKDNWYFNPATDEIINILPQKFFMNCAISIGVGIVVFSLSIIILSLVRFVKDKRKNAL